jgi:hypothetical protein
MKESTAAFVIQPFLQRLSEYVAYCPHHIGIGFPGVHIAYVERSNEKVYQCTFCSQIFPESQGIEVDKR